MSSSRVPCTTFRSGMVGILLLLVGGLLLHFVTAREFLRQMRGVWFDDRLSERLRDEAPAAYKDINAVLRAQRDLVEVTRVWRPV